ncbi:hypothetical protein [Paenibacillus tundrae]|uniref:hypothetical protein n=1 Tax=Paenibacillus tundrae TaxID=528187 RepID=UPI0030D57156
MKQLSPYVLARRNVVMTIIYMAVATFFAIYVAPQSLTFAIVLFVTYQLFNVFMLRHYIRKMKHLKEE